MRLFLTAIITVAALLLQPVLNQALGGSLLRPNLGLVPLVVAVSLCPGATAVVWCGLLGLVLDCLVGPQLGPRVAWFALLAAFASTVAAAGGRRERWPATIVLWATMFFAADALSRLIESFSLGGPIHLFQCCGAAAVSAAVTTVFMIAICLAGRIVFGRASSLRRLALPGGDAMFGD